MTLNTEHETSRNQSSTQYISSELECPFAWNTQSYCYSRTLLIFPYEMAPTLSFTATRNSKVLGYIPLIGTAIGVYRIFMGIREYLFFKKNPLSPLSNRSLTWIGRGALELIPILGGLVCIIIDYVATRMYNNAQNVLVNENERIHLRLIQGANGRLYPSVLRIVDPKNLSTALKIFSLSEEKAKKLDVINQKYTPLINRLKQRQSKLSDYMKQELQIQIDYVHSAHSTLVTYASSFPQTKPNDPPTHVPYELQKIDE